LCEVALVAGPERERWNAKGVLEPGVGLGALLPEPQRPQVRPIRRRLGRRGWRKGRLRAILRQRVLRLKGLVKRPHVQQREQPAPGVPEREVGHDPIVGEPVALDLQAPELDTRQLALCVASAVDRDNPVYVFECGPPCIGVGLCETHEDVRALDLEPQPAQDVEAVGGRRLHTQLRHLAPPAAAVARLEFLVDGDGQLLVVQERRQIRLEKRIAPELYVQGWVRALAGAQGLGLCHGNPRASLQERRASGLGEPDRLVQREARRDAGGVGRRGRVLRVRRAGQHDRQQKRGSRTSHDSSSQGSGSRPVAACACREKGT
jgi:hypothetical protein